MANPNMPIAPGPDSGLRMGYLAVKAVAGTVTANLFRGFGGSQGTVGGNALANTLAHMGVAETIDDDWVLTMGTSTDTAGLLLSAATANRKGVRIKNTGSNPMYLGKDSSIVASETDATHPARLLAAGAECYYAFGAAIPVYRRCTTGLTTTYLVEEYV